MSILTDSGIPTVTRAQAELARAEKDIANEEERIAAGENRDNQYTEALQRKQIWRLRLQGAQQRQAQEERGKRAAQERAQELLPELRRQLDPTTSSLLAAQRTAIAALSALLGAAAEHNERLAGFVNLLPARDFGSPHLPRRAHTTIVFDERNVEPAPVSLVLKSAVRGALARHGIAPGRQDSRDGGGDWLTGAHDPSRDFLEVLNGMQPSKQKKNASKKGERP